MPIPTTRAEYKQNGGYFWNISCNFSTPKTCCNSLYVNFHGNESSSLTVALTQHISWMPWTTIYRSQHLPHPPILAWLLDCRQCSYTIRVNALLLRPSSPLTHGTAIMQHGHQVYKRGWSYNIAITRTIMPGLCNNLFLLVGTALL